NVLKELKRFDEALADYDRTIALEPDHVEAFFNRGIVLGELKRHEAALASFDRAIALDPAHARAHFSRGSALVALRRLDERGGGAPPGRGTIEGSFLRTPECFCPTGAFPPRGAPTPPPMPPKGWPRHTRSSCWPAGRRRRRNSPARAPSSTPTVRPMPSPSG